MPFLTSKTPFVARSMVMRSMQSPSRAFSLSMRRAAFSENDVHRHDERDAEIDKHKHESVSKAKDGNGKWKPELASNSEAALKADQEGHNASKDHIEKLQKETTEHLENKKD